MPTRNATTSHFGVQCLDVDRCKQVGARSADIARPFQEKPIWEAVSPGLGPEGDSEVANDDDDEPLSLQVLLDVIPCSQLL